MSVRDLAIPPEMQSGLVLTHEHDPASVMVGSSGGHYPPGESVPATLDATLARITDLLKATSSAAEGAPLTVWKEAEKVQQQLAGTIDKAKKDPAYAVKWTDTAKSCIDMLRDQASMIALAKDSLKGAEVALQQAIYEVGRWLKSFKDATVETGQGLRTALMWGAGLGAAAIILKVFWPKTKPVDRSET